MLPTRDPPQNKRSTQTEVEGLEKIFQENGQEKSQDSNTYIRQNRLQNKGHKKRHRRTLHILKGRIHQEEVSIVNICIPNIGAPKYIKNILEDFKKDLNSNTLILGDF